jgi:hypothetical protein
VAKDGAHDFSENAHRLLPKWKRSLLPGNAGADQLLQLNHGGKACQCDPAQMWSLAEAK